jgi:transcriptional regulator GlxA family with amidase domain
MGKQYVTLLRRSNKNGKRNAVICSASWFEQRKGTRQKKSMTVHKRNYNKTT